MATYSNIAAVAQRIGSAGHLVNRLLTTHGASFNAVDSHLQTIINNVDNAQTVINASVALANAPNIPADILKYAEKMQELASGDPADYNSTEVLLLVSKAQAVMVNANTAILGWLNNLKSSKA